MPYNYLLDRSFRDSLDLDLSRAILIFDDAHNLSNAAELS
jgi:Rad3-related DNA helicase